LPDASKSPEPDRRIYEVNGDGLSQMRAELDRFWSSALAAYKAAVEQPQEDDQ
jgi:hypothetical protein